MNAIGEPVSRVDGPAKVTGTAPYTAEFALPGMAFAALVTSTIAKGRILAIDTGEAERAPGVLVVLHHGNAERLPYRQRKQRPQVDPKSGDQLRVFQDDRVLFSGQPVAVVVAETQAQARGAAALVRLRYRPEPPTTEFDPERAQPPSEPTEKAGRPGEKSRGDAEAAFDRAPVKISQRYSHAREHHNALEPHATIAAWDGGRLTLHDKTQWVDNVRAEIAHVFGLNEADVRVISPFVGGAFGSALRTWPHVTVAALAARRVGRPVCLELTRRECYTSIGFRPLTEQRAALGADRDGRLTAIIQEAEAQTSSYEEYAEVTLEPAHTTYACPNVSTRYRLMHMNTNSPCPMRAPGIATGLVALEMAMDELAEATGIDPVELRLRNYAERDEDKDLPWSSKELRACYRIAAERFGWHRRNPAPGSMRSGRWRVGYGMATAIYHAQRSPATASATLYANGSAVVRSAASDMGPGTYTAMTQVAAEILGLPIERVRFELGDTAMPTAPVHGGSITMASVGNAVRVACLAVRDKLGAADFPAELRRRGLDSIEAIGEAMPGDEQKRFASAAFGAVFAEVHVDPETGIVRVPRLIGAYDVGRVVNPKTARSQAIGGLVQGIGMALLEQAEWDPRLGRVMNANLAEYLVPVNADVVETEAIFVPCNDTNFNPLGVKGLAEIALCGPAPAIANAVWHATGKRIRDLPITPEKLLA